MPVHHCRTPDKDGLADKPGAAISELQVRLVMAGLLSHKFIGDGTQSKTMERWNKFAVVRCVCNAALD